MPEVSRFNGITIYIYYGDHHPPHFHARYGGEEALISINNPTVMEGNLPGKILSVVLQWSGMHESEIAEQWNNARKHLPLGKIPPLAD